MSEQTKGLSDLTPLLPTETSQIPLGSSQADEPAAPLPQLSEHGGSTYMSWLIITDGCILLFYVCV